MPPLDAGGNAFTFDGHHWKKYKDVDSSSGGLESVSCGSPKSCWAADGQGFFLHFDGRRWSAPAIEDPPPAGGYSNVAVTLSCPTASFCLAVDINGAALVWQHGKWSRRFPQGVDTFERVTCTTSLFCMAGEHSGRALSWYRGQWSKARTISAGNGISALVVLPDHILRGWNRVWSRIGVARPCLVIPPNGSDERRIYSGSCLLQSGQLPFGRWVWRDVHMDRLALDKVRHARTRQSVLRFTHVAELRRADVLRGSRTGGTAA